MITLLFIARFTKCLSKITLLKKKKKKKKLNKILRDQRERTLEKRGN